MVPPSVTTPAACTRASSRPTHSRTRSVPKPPVSSLTAVTPSVPQAAAAVLAGAVRVGEWGDDQVAGPEVLHLRPGLLDHADELVAHLTGVVGQRGGLVRPQVAAAHAADHDADDRVGGILDLRVGDVLDADVAGLVQESGAHGGVPFVDC